MTKQVFILNNLNCAHCAGKIEDKIKSMPELQNVAFNFTTKKLTLNSNVQSDKLLKLLQQVCDSIEDGVIVELEESKSKAKAKSTLKSNKKEVITLVCGIFFLIIAIICEHMLTFNNAFILHIVLYVVAYIILGGNIVVKAGRNLLKGQVFDENFLMSIATLGAFAIGEYTEAVGVMLFFKVGELFEKIAVEKSRSQIVDAIDLRPETVNLVTDNSFITIPIEDAKEGDILLVRPGDRIPLDGTITEGESRIDTSAVTGESVPVAVKTGDSVLSGCVNTSNLIKLKVEKVLSDSMVTRILNSVESAAAGKPKIESFITRFSRIYTPIVVAIALITAIVIPLVTKQPFEKWVYTALSFLVMSCPCALVLSVPLAFFSGIGAASKKGILFKNGLSIEALSKVKSVVMDKTGTLTKGCFEVQQIIPYKIEQTKFLQLCASCEQNSTHPIATSIVEYTKGKNIDILQVTKVEEKSGKGICAVIDGKSVLCGNKALLEEYNVDLSNYQNQLAGTEVLLAVDGFYSGCIVIADTIKSDAKQAISKVKEKHIHTAMLTGDEENTAKSVATSTGIEEYHAKLLPDEKLNLLQKIRKAHGNVMFVGDGINDAPVLAGADIGAAMGSGADAALEVADVVFMNSSVNAIPASIEISKKTTIISRQNVIFALAVKLIVMILGITGIYSDMWLAVFADTGVAMLCIINSIRILYKYRK